MRSRQSQSESAAAAQCDDICTEEWEDYVFVTVDPNQSVNKHRVGSIESSLDSGYEEIHMPPPAPGATAATSEENAAAGSGSISTGANKNNNNGEAKQVSKLFHGRGLCVHSLATAVVPDYLLSCAEL